MNKLGLALRNLREYVRSLLARRKRKKREKDDDPFIYPLF